MQLLHHAESNAMNKSGRPLFGLNVPTSTEPGTDPIAFALRAEALGFDFLSANDHLHGPSPRYEAWTLLSWIAARTSCIRLATRVLGVPYRNPAVLAKMAESFDRLSDGRLILGIGAGSGDQEFRAFGLGEVPLRDRMTGLDEAMRICRALWTRPTYTFAGTLHRTEDAQIEPKAGHAIPIWLGTHGKRGLDLTGWLADGWIPSLGYAPPEQIPSMLERIRGAARDAGRDPREITKIYNIEVSAGREGVDADVIAGEPGAIAERLAELLALGFDGFNLVLEGPDLNEQAELVAREVIPAVGSGLTQSRRA
jgi:probable F420-dependent oxidoreductase